MADYTLLGTTVAILFYKSLRVVLHTFYGYEIVSDYNFCSDSYDIVSKFIKIKLRHRLDESKSIHLIFTRSRKRAG